jgi:Tfp pilus assembly protein PilN
LQRKVYEHREDRDAEESDRQDIEQRQLLRRRTGRLLASLRKMIPIQPISTNLAAPFPVAGRWLL